MYDEVNRSNVVDLNCCDEADDKKKSSIEERLLEHRVIMVADQVSRKLMDTVVAKLLLLEAKDPNAQITVYVNSPGGCADSGFAIYDAMKFISCPVRTICSGLCASAGVIIYLGGDKGQRFSFNHSRFLIHQPSTGAQGQASDIEITAKEIIKVRDRYNSIVSNETEIPMKKIEKDANRDFWLSTKEAVKYGLIDKIITKRNEIE